MYTVWSLLISLKHYPPAWCQVSKCYACRIIFYSSLRLKQSSHIISNAVHSHFSTHFASSKCPAYPKSNFKISCGKLFQIFSLMLISICPINKTSITTNAMLCNMKAHTFTFLNSFLYSWVLV